VISRFTSRLSKFHALCRRDKQVLLRAAAMLVLYRAALAFAGLAKVDAWAQRNWVSEKPTIEIENDSPESLARLVGVAARLAPGRPSCLVRALVLRSLLRRAGAAAVLRIGVRLECGRLDAHAWVECNGRAIGEAAEVATRYAPFPGALSSRQFT
jgi:hypothetical protein